MARTLSSLDSVGLPLAGTEWLYIDPAGVDRKVAVSDLMAFLTSPPDSNYRIRLAPGKGLQLANLDDSGTLLGWRSIWLKNGVLTISDTDDSSS